MEDLLRFVNIEKARWASSNQSWATCYEKLGRMLEDSLFHGATKFLHVRGREWLTGREVEEIATFLVLDEQQAIIRVLVGGKIIKGNAIEALRMMQLRLIKHGTTIFTDLSVEWE